MQIEASCPFLIVWASEKKKNFYLTSSQRLMIEHGFQYKEPNDTSGTSNR